MYGVLVPAIVRERAEGGYELISGHRRHHAAVLAGLEEMPVIVKNCDDDESTVLGKELCELDREVICIVNLRTDGIPLNCNFVSVGVVDQSIAHPREIFKSSILSNATSMILIHNHPSGNLEPSKWDTILTDRMLKLGELIGIPVVDHIIVGGENKEYFSFKEKGILEFEHNSFEIDYRKLDAERFAVAENEIDHVVTPRRRRSR